MIEQNPVDPNLEFEKAIKADPFEGLAVVGALARIIKGFDTLPADVKATIDPIKASGVFLERTTQALVAATQAKDEAYVQIFTAQKQGLEAAQRIDLTANAPQAAATKTATKSMSNAKK
jgi:hypothetical protein